MLPAIIKTVLLRTDAPELVLARDACGRQYLGTLIDRSDDGDRFLVIPISPERLAQFRSGSKDLRTVLLSTETGEHFDGWFRRIDGQPAIELSGLSKLPQDWLPDDGFLLSDFYTKIDDSEVVREAINRNATVLVCQVDPPEARYEPRIDADRLTQCVSGFQTLVRQIVRKLARNLSEVERTNLGLMPGALDVFQFSEGSFKIHFQAKQRPDLFGGSAVSNALVTIDELMRATSKPTDDALAIVRKNKGLVVGAYAKVLRFVADETAPLVYRWADPSMSSSSGAEVTPTAATALSAAIATEKLLESEIVVLRGRFTKIFTRHTWTVINEKGRRVAGQVHEDYANVLSGIISETQLYDLTCEERLAETAAGRQSTKLFLISAAKVSKPDSNS